jgi:hypothetical protein
MKMPDNDRAATISIGGAEYELILTTGATKQIAKKYGGLSDLGNKLIKTENFELALDEVTWLLALLANQSILIHNLKNPQDKRELLTEESLELLTTPFELAAYKDAIMAAMAQGTKRNVRSEGDDNGGDAKNTTGA